MHPNASPPHEILRVTVLLLMKLLAITACVYTNVKHFKRTGQCLHRVDHPLNLKRISLKWFLGGGRDALACGSTQPFADLQFSSIQQMKQIHGARSASSCSSRWQRR